MISVIRTSPPRAIGAVKVSSAKPRRDRKECFTTLRQVGESAHEQISQSTADGGGGNDKITTMRTHTQTQLVTLRVLRDHLTVANADWFVDSGVRKADWTSAGFCT